MTFAAGRLTRGPLGTQALPESRRSIRWAGRSGALFILASLLVALVPNWEVVIGGKTFLPAGTVQGVYPWRSQKSPPHYGGIDGGAIAWAVLPWTWQEHRALAAGTLPFWNPHQALGEPLLSNGQTATLNPLHWIVLLDPDSPALWDLQLLLLRFLCALFSCHLLGMLGARAGIACLGAVLGGLHGSFTVLLARTDVVAFATMPAILYFLARLRREPGPAGAAGLVAALYLCLTAGHPEPSAAVLLGCAATGAAMALGSPRFVLRAAAAAAVALLLSAPCWLPFLRLIPLSWNIHPPGLVQATGPPRLALQWLVPGIFGKELGAFLDRPAPAKSFLGVIAGTLAIAGVLSAVVTRRRVALLLIGGVLCLQVLGGGWLGKLPLISRMSVYYFEFPALYLLACAGLLALDDLSQSTPRARALVFGGAAALAVGALALAKAFVPQGTPGGLSPAFGPQLALAGVLSAAAAALGIAIASRKRLQPVWIALLFLAMAGELAFYRYPLADRVNVNAPPPYARWLQAKQQEGPAFRVMGLGDFFMPDYATAWGLDDVRICDALIPSRYQRYLTALLEEQLQFGWLFHASPRFGFRLPNPALDLLGVRYLVGDRRDYPAFATAGRIALTGAEMGEGAIIENPDAWPRFYAVENPIAEPSEERALARVAERLREPGRFAVVEADFPAARWMALRPGAPPELTVFAPRRGPNDLELTAEVRAPAVLVVAEALTEGWRAWVDGMEQPIFHANFLFRGLVLEPGRHRIRFAYRPPGWTLALAFCALGALLGVAGLARLRSTVRRVSN